MRPSTAWPEHLRPNQQLVAQLRAEAGRDPDAATRRRRTLGADLRRSLAGSDPPLLALRSHHSLLEGTASLEAWGEVLADLHGADQTAANARRGGNQPGGAVATVLAEQALRQALASAQTDAKTEDATRPGAHAQMDDGRRETGATGCWAALCDRDDLAGLPAALEHWGRGRVGVGACLAGPACSPLSRLTAPPALQDTLLLAENEPAYARLCRLLSARHEDPARWQDRIDASGLIALVRDASVGRWLRERGAEVWWRSDLIAETRPVPFPIACVPLVDHLDGDGVLVAPILAAIRERSTVDDRRPAGTVLADLARLPERYRGREEQLAAGAALRARLGWAPAGSWRMPPLPEEFVGLDADRELRRLAEAGLIRRYPAEERPAAMARLDHELTVIAGKGFAPYLLTVWAIARGRRTCGRGSGASSIVCYLLGITNVDPLRLRLRFERFLTPERSDPPDVDIDFPWDERDTVLAETFARFGHEHTALVATHQHLHHDGALREAARAHGLADAQIGDMAGRLARRDRNGEPVDLPAPWPAILATTRILSGAPRHFGVHCGGVVMTSGPIRELVPIHPAAKHLPGEGTSVLFHAPTIAWEKDGAEALGLVKVDLLGNRSLAVVRDALADLAEDGVTIEEARWRPDEDPATRRLIATGGTMGCFYIESPAMRQLQRKVGSGDFDRLVIHSSIIRPAGNALITTYIARHHHWLACDGRLTPEESSAWFPHEALRELVSDSYGILSYQEDVMLVTQAMAGFGTREANELRKALGRSDSGERLRPLAGRFAAGCRTKGITDEVIAMVWMMISSFAGYSFCKAHSASYAMVSFQCAWLKAHHPAHFLARVIANEGGFYTACAYVEEARRLGLAIRPPCVLRSHWATRAEGAGAIRLGFHLVKGLARSLAETLETARSERSFAGLGDLVRRTGGARDGFEALHEAGALEALTPTATSAQRAWLMSVALRSDRPSTRDRQGQGCLDLGAGDPDPVPPDLPAVPRGRLLGRRFRRLLLLPEAHPLCLWKLPERPTTRIRDVQAGWEGRSLELVAWSITRKTVNAVYRRDEAGRELAEPRVTDMAFVTLEDETGLLETTWFPDVFSRHGVLLEAGDPLLIRGRIAVAYGLVTLEVSWARSAAA